MGTKRQARPCACCGQEIEAGEHVEDCFGSSLRWGIGATMPLVYIYCRGCEAAFLALPRGRQQSAITAAFDRAFTAPQFIYSLLDPESQMIRYIGRAGNLTKRFQRHLADRHAQVINSGRNGGDIFTRSNWIHTLMERGLQPTLAVLQVVDPAPLVIEWERRYIADGLQRGLPLLNLEGYDQRLVEQVRAAQVDFLRAPLDELTALRLAGGWFEDGCIETFLRAWYLAPEVRSL